MQPQQQNIDTQNGQSRGLRDFNQPPIGKSYAIIIINKGYRQPKYQRDPLPEEQEGKISLGGAYQSYLHCLGDCFGWMKSILPCFICCVEYPYHQVDQSWVGVQERFGVYIKTVQPGLIYVNPCTDTLRKVDCKVQLIDCPRQWVMTKDNILVSIDATCYYRVVAPRKSVYNVSNIHAAVSQLTLATIKGIVGGHTLQELLEKRQEISHEIENFVDQHVWEWVHTINKSITFKGVDIENLLIKDIQLNQELQQTLSMTAKEERSAKAKVINAQADVESAKLMKEAAGFLDSKAAMQIRYLETITILGKQTSTKVIFLPEE